MTSVAVHRALQLMERTIRRASADAIRTKELYLRWAYQALIATLYRLFRMELFFLARTFLSFQYGK
ncbi:MAG TPA: hypothetical protein VIP56_09045 [Nitrososphaeraceae archaeon]